MDKKPTSKTVLRFWGVSSIGIQLVQNMDTTFFAYFLTDVVKFSSPLAGTVLTLTSSIDLFFSIFVGAFIGMINPMKWGRLRSYQLILPPFVILFFTLQFTVIGSGTGAAFLMILFYVLAHICSTTAYTADFAMVAEIAATPQDRIKLNSNRMVGSNFGRLFTGYAVPTIVAFVRGFASEQIAYFYLAFAFSFLFAVTYFAHFKMGEGYENQGGNKKTDENLKLRDVLTAFAANKNLAAIVISDLSSTVGSFVIPALNVYYYKYIAVTMPNVTLPIHLLFSSLTGLAGAWLAGIAGKKVREKKKVLLVTYALMAVLIAVMRMFALTSAYLFFVFQISMQLVQGFTQPLESDLYMDVAVYHEWKTGKNCTAFIMGLLNIPVKVGQVIKNISIAMLLAAVNYAADMPATPELMQGIANGYIYTPLAAPLLGIVILGLVFSIKASEVPMMQKEVNERRRLRAQEVLEEELADL